MITHKILDSMKPRPCADAVKWFLETFPKGVDQHTALNHSGCLPGWRVWWAIHTPGLTFTEREDLADSSYDPALCRVKIAAYAPGLTPAERKDFKERRLMALCGGEEK